MNLNSIVSNSTAIFIAGPIANLASGRLGFNHHRCGRVVIEQRARHWVVIEIERPDPTPKKRKSGGKS